MIAQRQKLRPALFLDRDGVINEERGFVFKPKDCVLVEGVAPLLRTANQLGYVTCVVTNQSGIARGLYTEQDFYHLMDYIESKLREEGAFLDAVYFCPYHPEHGEGAYRRESDCRKPAPGMLHQAAREHGIDISRSLLVGDRCTDLVAGEAAGVPTLFLFGNAAEPSCPVAIQYNRVNTLCSVEQHLLTTCATSLG